MDDRAVADRVVMVLQKDDGEHYVFVFFDNLEGHSRMLKALSRLVLQDNSFTAHDASELFATVISMERGT